MDERDRSHFVTGQLFYGGYPSNVSLNLPLLSRLA